ncbi:unnamed protein product [Echinostoma caproni]|uniref:Reverse transcriptase domain-containing protein n=1 Tax=Echinostoma caproni TaxID=27848 RepID=A0A183AK21_9TREM|nr:unnamed protein product [Echinostoma caproni]
MYSLNVTSLFTNVPLLETSEFLCEYIAENHLETGIPLPTLKEHLLRCTFGVQFLFNGRIYQQTNGVAMGSPLGPRLADIFMGKLESTILQPTILLRVHLLKWSEIYRPDYEAAIKEDTRTPPLVETR